MARSQNMKRSTSALPFSQGNVISDMLTARQKLDKVIEEMDKIMTSRFRDAYLQLSDAFDKSFNRLFGGGSAALYLSQPDELLETGVEIRVRSSRQKSG